MRPGGDERAAGPAAHQRRKKATKLPGHGQAHFEDRDRAILPLSCVQKERKLRIAGRCPGKPRCAISFPFGRPLTRVVPVHPLVPRAANPGSFISAKETHHEDHQTIAGHRAIPYPRLTRHGRAATRLRGALVQEAFPNLSAAEREFILTGITAEEWETEVIGPRGAV